MESDLRQYIKLFIEESKEHLQNMNDVLLVLEKEKDNVSLINEIFRITHTLKGMSGTMGFVNMANLTHQMESVLDEVRNNNIELNEEIIDVFFECFDTLDEIVNHIEANGEEIDEENIELINKLKKVLLVEDSIKSKEDRIEEKADKYDDYVLNVMKEAINRGFNVYRIHISLSPNCMLKTARAFIIFKLLESVGNIIYSNPPVDDIEDEKFDFSFTVILVTNINKEDLTEKLYNISEVDDVKVDQLDNKIEYYRDLNRNKGKGNATKPLTNDKKDKFMKSKNKNNKIGKTVRVDIDRLDTLMNLVSELIIIKTRMDDLSENLNMDEMTETIEYLARITTNLHDAVMKVRMVPIERIFNRFPRMVRDLSKELDKKVDLIIHGENTEVDRTVIDEIGDPLVHLLRNSIDHGIEKPEDRLKLGKSEEGKIVLKAYPDGNSVVIELSDDGRGIDYDKVKEKAISKGLLSKENAEELTEEELKNILFEPGFSTSDTITEISGRGVGLDVVKNIIESINGSIEVESEKDKGSKFTIRIPLTLAIIQALLVKIGYETYAIPLSSIIEIIIINKEDIRDLQEKEIILYRDKTIPIVRLDRVMGIEIDKAYDEHIAVVVRKGEKKAALLVSSLIGQQEIVIKPLGKYLSNIKLFSGATILGNGNISLIIDVNSLI